MKSSAKNDFAARLRAAREKRELSQAALAKKADLEPSAVSHFETGRRKPSFANLRRLCDALGVTTDYLLGRVEDMGATGPEAQRLFRKVQELSEEDLIKLEQIADVLGAKE